jgi:hypothetical protein
MPSRRGVGWGLSAAIVVLSFVGVFFVAKEPHLRAYLCPTCAGFHQIAPRVYADDGASELPIIAALKAFSDAEEMLQRAYPGRASDPIWLLCLSGDCGVKTPPRPLAMAYLDLFVFVYPEGVTATILAHELAHAELHARLGTAHRLVSNPVPTWFDEGLAVLVSQDPRYLEVVNGEVAGCKAGDWPEPPSDPRSFRRRAATDAEALYTASACRVIDWLDDNGAVDALPPVLEQIRIGTVSFE